MTRKSKVAIVVDSSSCLPDNLVQEWGIWVVPHELVVNGLTYADGIDINPTQFYGLLRDGSQSVSTSAPKPSSFMEVFRLAAEEADSILCLTVASEFSATFQVASIAQSVVQEEMSGTAVKIVDSRTAAGAEGLMALLAAKAARKGALLDDVVAQIEDVAPRVHLLACLDRLDNIRRSGRAPTIAVWAGAVLGIKPIAELRAGQAKLISKPRTRRRAMERLLKEMKDRVHDERVQVNIMHGDELAEAYEIHARVAADFNCSELFISEFTPVMGAHLGPGLIGLAFFTDG